jgi:hypothetical protein
MAAVRRLTLGDLTFGKPRIKPRWEGRFAVLNRRFVFKYPPGLSRQDLIRATTQAAAQHRAAMMRLLRQQAGLPAEGPLSEGQIKVLLSLLLLAYVPAFDEVELKPASRPPGRPATGLTARQKAVIDKAHAAGRSVRKAARRLARGDEKKTEALAAAWRRATKPGIRRN